MDLFNLFLKTTYELYIKIIATLTTGWGWLIALCSFVVSFFDKESELLIKIIWVVVFIDLVLGIASAIKRKKHVLSQAIIKSAFKYAIYTLFFWVMVAAEKGIGADLFIASKITFGFAVAAEAWSMMAHIAILNPGFIFVRILRKALAGEVAKKLGCTPDEAIAILDGKEVLK